jgi:HSP20 family protein
MKIDNDVLTMEFDVPGLSKKDINVKVEDTVLSIEGDNENRTFNKRYNIQEDWDVSKTSAAVKDGVLTVSIPKVEEKKAKVIEVSVR